MSQQTVLTHVLPVKNGNIFEIIINRPEVHNCVNGETAELLLAAWKRFRDDTDLTVAILRGNGEKSFCAGADLNALETLMDINGTNDEIRHWVKNSTGPMGGSRVVQRKPVITVSQGYTYAGGLELFCHGHIRIAEKQAMFSVACRRWGVPLADGGTVYLPWLIGPGSALPLIITGQRIRAERAQAIGLVWEIVPKGKGIERARRYAEQICSVPRDALMADLSSAIDGYGRPIEEALEIEARGIYPVVTSDSFREGVSNFQKGERFWFR
ncbi:enoyl-CoA hydratase/isomerase family protein [Leptospira broomii serovar Hurstbridge str. 5399]|uniref:Enoyl-CoA hydratase/isomerase family protein n=1 Tax=Leptospira broomii serovar Hurstbridge str. 5399 TaxID=1049789 RepID=T0F726_9LEPT|nr:enoyl-CoA hydratase-related protein [Leptospira broomii]EQA43327.1 enoyl-CoA hydratase/isomerase family protein [Leptospira broomii serovar Hurstbridge str. 5399]